MILSQHSYVLLIIDLLIVLESIADVCAIMSGMIKCLELQLQFLRNVHRMLSVVLTDVVNF